MASYSPRNSIIINFLGEYEAPAEISATDFRDFRSDFLGEYKAICETVFNQGPIWG
jgi:hypothetical protein